MELGLGSGLGSYREGVRGGVVNAVDATMVRNLGPGRWSVGLVKKWSKNRSDSCESTITNTG